MSITFCWRPVKEPKRFGHGTSSDRAALEKVFGTFPIELSGVHVHQLRAMHAVSGQETSIYAEIADKIEQVGAICVWGEY